MMKAAVLILLVGYAAASGLFSSQRAVIKHITPHGYGNGISSRYFDKAEYGLGVGAGRLGGYAPGYLSGYRAGNLGGYGAGYLGGYGGNAYDSIDNLVLAYNNYDVAGAGVGIGGARVGLF